MNHLTFSNVCDIIDILLIDIEVFSEPTTGSSSKLGIYNLFDDNVQLHNFIFIYLSSYQFLG